MNRDIYQQRIDLITELEGLVRRTARRTLGLEEGQYWNTQVSRDVAEAVAAFIANRERMAERRKE